MEIFIYIQAEPFLIYLHCDHDYSQIYLVRQGNILPG
jgi:hypothetical protein